MGMGIEYTIFFMMRLKSFRPEVDKSWQSRQMPLATGSYVSDKKR
jgi:predicted RND superfamily exporter protein